MNVLFLNQGRARLDETVGPLTIPRSIKLGLPDVVGDVEPTFLELPPFNRWHRRLMRPLPGFKLQSVRWHLIRSWSAREAILDQMYLSEPDVVHLTNSHIAFLLGGIQRKLPCVPTLDTLVIDWARAKRSIPADAKTPSFLRPLVPLERRALEIAPLNIAYTNTVAKRIREFAPAARVTALHPGLDLDSFRPTTKARASGPLRVLFVGARWKAKGGPELLEALAPSLGQGVELDVVTQETFDVPSGVTTHVAAPGTPLVPELFRRADVFCLPSHADAVPWVILEAMASGVPVVSTKVGSIPEMLGDAGLTCEPGDVAGLRKALELLLGDSPRRRAMSEAGRARAEKHYDARKTTPKLIELLREVANAR